MEVYKEANQTLFNTYGWTSSLKKYKMCFRSSYIKFKDNASQDKKKSNIIKVRKIWLRINTIFVIITLSYTRHSSIRSKQCRYPNFQKQELA